MRMDPAGERTVRLGERTVHPSNLASSIAEAEASARALLKQLKKAHQNGAHNLTPDVRFVDALVTRLGAKRRFVMKDVGATRPRAEP